MKKILLFDFKYIFKYKALYFICFVSQILIRLSELFIPIMEGAVIDSFNSNIFDSIFYHRVISPMKNNK